MGNYDFVKIATDRQQLLSHAESVSGSYYIAVRDMQHGISEANACRRNNIKQSDFKKFLETLRFDKVSRCLPKDEKDFKLILSGYERLYVELFRITNLTELPPDCDKTFEHVLKTLSPREQKVINAKWCGDRSFEMIAADYNVTGTRIQQIHAKAIRKLKQRNRRKILKYGLKVYETFAHMRENCSKDIVSDYVSELESVARDKIEYNDLVALQKLRDDIDKYISNLRKNGTVASAAKLATIEELDLSVRTHNCLHRAGYTYIHELENLSYLDLMKMRNFGSRCLAELTEKCKPYGITFKEDEV